MSGQCQEVDQKSGKCQEFDTCLRNVGKLTKSQGSVWKVRKNMFIAKFMFGAMPVFGSIMQACLLYCCIQSG